jgi:membrane protease YdiL (CAAX protease family)
MNMSFVLIFPFILIALVANLTELNRQVRWITLLLLALSNLLVLLSALLVLLMELANALGEIPLESLPLQPQYRTTAAILALTGLVGFVPLIKNVRRLLSRWLSIDPDSTVHTTALVFAVYLLGLTLAQLPFVGGLEGLESLDVPLGPAELWMQALALLLMAVIGVGLGLRRGVPETASRLGLRWPTWRAWLGVVVLVVLLEALDYGVAAAWEALDPATYERIGRISRGLFGEFMSLWGALAVGVAAGLSEETLFRGALQPRFGFFLTNVLFAVSHVQYGFTPATLVIFVIGLVLSWVRKRWGLLAAIAVHALYNIVNLLLATLWP